MRPLHKRILYAFKSSVCRKTSEASKKSGKALRSIKKGYIDADREKGGEVYEIGKF